MRSKLLRSYWDQRLLIASNTSTVCPQVGRNVDAQKATPSNDFTMLPGDPGLIASPSLVAAIHSALPVL